VSALYRQLACEYHSKALLLLDMRLNDAGDLKRSNIEMRATATCLEDNSHPRLRLTASREAILEPRGTDEKGRD